MDLPPRPPGIDTDEQILRSWKREAAAVYTLNAKMESKRFEFARLLSLAEEYRHDTALYFPHQLDFRGRLYAVPISLSPQGADPSRGMLQFASGMPVPDGDPFQWWLVNGANLFGYDKASLEDRAGWADDRLAAAIECGRDPFASRWWMEADKPWCFLAWCMEAVRLFADPDGFVSHLPVGLDGSCNGLQHFSAMLRDPVGGAAVNLVPSDTPQDIYQRVADRVVERLRDRARSGADDAWIAQGWVDFGIARKIAKRPVMVMPYGGTVTSCIEYVREAVYERIRDGQENPFGIELTKATAFLGTVVWASIGDVVVAAKQAMGWLQKTARIAARHGLPLEWVTPSGFVAHQQYREHRHRRVKTRLHGSLIYLSHFEETDRLNADKNATALSPNFVHSLDAAALIRTVCLAVDAGISDFAMVHDSYGTHAYQTAELARLLRQAFVSMYEEHDVLADLAASLSSQLPPGTELPPLPKTGNLDISGC